MVIKDFDQGFKKSGVGMGIVELRRTGVGMGICLRENAKIWFYWVRWVDEKKER